MPSSCTIFKTVISFCTGTKKFKNSCYYLLCSLSVFLYQNDRNTCHRLRFHEVMVNPREFRWGVFWMWLVSQSSLNAAGDSIVLLVVRIDSEFLSFSQWSTIAIWSSTEMQTYLGLGWDKGRLRLFNDEHELLNCHSRY